MDGEDIVGWMIVLMLLMGVSTCCGHDLMKDWQKGKCLENHNVEDCNKLKS